MSEDTGRDSGNPRHRMPRSGGFWDFARGGYGKGESRAPVRLHEHPRNPGSHRVVSVASWQAGHSLYNRIVIGASAIALMLMLASLLVDGLG